MRRSRVVVAVVVVALLGLDVAAAGSVPARPGVMKRASVARTPTARTIAGTTGFAQGHTILWESDAQLARDLDGMARTGASWLRLDFDWPSIQSGGPDAWNWAPTDRVVNAASARGISILATPTYTPTWARPAGTTGKHPPTDPLDYVRFVQAAVRRYEPRGVQHWEIWNEPNLDDFWNPAPDPVAYTKLFVLAADAIHALDADAIVMNGGLAPASDIFGDAMAPRSFLTVMYANGAGAALDAVAMHPYSFPYEPMLAADWNAFSTLPKTHALMAAFGDGRKPIWATEAGFGTGRDDHSVSEAVHAVRVRQLIDAWYDFDFTGNIFLYTFRDLSATSPAAFERMGIVRADGSPKPAFAVFSRAIERSTIDRDVQQGLCGPAAHLAPAGANECVEAQRVARFVRERLLGAMHA
jgi:hypothetical protein